MGSSLGSMDFFALEAGEYLERLGSIVAQEGGPKRDEFVRFARALRGSALMANQADFATAAGGLEAIARAYRDGGLAWDAAARETAAQGIEDLKELLRRAASWGQAETQKATRLAHSMEQLAGQPGPATRRRTTDAEPGTLNTGVRAFVAREGALIASALERAGRALATDPSDMESVHNSLRRMQSLRGLAELTDLSPLPEMLDGLEIAVANLTRMHARPPEVAEVFRSGAEAMTRASRDVAHQGRPDPESNEALGFARTLVGAFALEDDVVPIGALAPDASASVITPGKPPAGPNQLGAVEVVSQGEHLIRQADTLLSAGSLVERQLRLFSTLDMLRGMKPRVGQQLGEAFAAFADAAQALIRTAEAGPELSSFGHSLRQSGETLKMFSDEEGQGTTIAQVRALAVSLGTREAETKPPVAEEPVEAVVPIEDLAPSPTPTPELSTRPATATTSGPEGSDLAASFDTYHRLRMESGTAQPALAMTATQHTGENDREEPVVDIDTLLFRGAAARERAKHLGREISECLDRPGIFMGLKPLLEELLDILPLTDEPAVR